MNRAASFFTFLLISACALAQEATVASFPVQQFVLTYGREYSGAPALGELTVLSVPIGIEGNLYVEAGATSAASVKLGDNFAADTRFTEPALRQVFSALVADLNQRGFYGVYVVPSGTEIDAQSREDLRTPDNRNLTLVIWISEIAEIRTIGKGARLPAGKAIQNPKHRRLAKHSPLGVGSLFKKLQIDDYLRRLNRHPGRKVDAAISATDEPGRVVLDYLVNENRPWFIYGQISNTGTEATDVLRERVGLVHNQLFSQDDIASLDYITSNFSKANAVFGSYSLPVFFPDKLKARAYGSWGDFNATTELSALTAPGGTPIPPEEFSGDSWLAGIELTASPWAFRNIAIDLVVGIAAQHVAVNNKTLVLEGEADLLTPYASLRLGRETEVYNFSASIGYETNLEDTPAADLVRLGRLDTNSSYDMIRGEFSGSVYLEPLFNRISKENSWKKSTLAHEFALSLRGQHTLGDDRLIPQKEQAIGGFFSVRGYPESVVAGDRVYTASAEYRFHFPRALRPASVKDESEDASLGKADRSTLFGRPFNLRPLRPYARPDWDLIFRGFVDTGFTEISDGTQSPRPEDRDHSLISAGAGLEIQLFRNFNFRADLGWAFKEVKTGVESSTGYIEGPNDVSSGSVRGHFLLTVVW